jgi:hypothetical protein
VTGPRQNICVVVGSSDNTADVARQVLPAFDRYWPDCPYERYVLLSTPAAQFAHPGWRRIDSGSTSGWRPELIAGLRQIPEQYDHLLLFLDDFLLTNSVDTTRLEQLLSQGLRMNAAYLRLVPLERAIWARYRLRPARNGIDRIRSSEPYYSSLQLAMWQRQHLQDLLATPGNIWDFEHQRPAAGTHYAVTGPPPCRYVHVVEKGRWMPYAPQLFRAANIGFAPGSRPLLNRSYHRRHLLKKLQFGLTGYGPMRARRWLSRLLPRR